MLIAALLGPLLLQACPAPCKGVGCAESYSAALIGVHPGHDPLPRVDGALSALQGALFIEGTAAQGPDWDLVVRPGALLVGVPAADRVRLYTDDDGAEGQILLRGDRVGDGFGAALATLPDLDGDGAASLAVAAPLLDRDDTSRDNGAVFLFDDPTQATAPEGPRNATLRLAGRSTGARLGQVLAGCGDMDGDGIAELAVGAPLAQGDDRLTGAATLVLSRDRDRRELDAESLSTHWTGQRVGAQLSAALSCAADLTADGAADLLVAAPFDGIDHDGEGVVYLLPGGDLPPAGPLRPTGRYFQGRSANAWLGAAIATGDLDGDGTAEVILGAPGIDEGRGAAFLWWADALPATGPAPFPQLRILGQEVGDAAGAALATGDLDGDGFDDLMIGAPKRNPTEDKDPEAYESGALYIFRGAADLANTRPVMQVDEADVIYETPSAFLRTGQHIRAGDFDEDGLDDLILLHRTRPDD